MPWGGNKPQSSLGGTAEEGRPQQGAGSQEQVPEAPMGVVPVGHFGMCFGGRADEMDGGQ